MNDLGLYSNKESSTTGDTEIGKQQELEKYAGALFKTLKDPWLLLRVKSKLSHR